MKIILPVLISLFLTSAVSAQTNPQAADFFKTGIEFRDKNMYPEAYISFKKAIASDKLFDSAYIEIGLLCQMVKNNDSALLCFNKALSINPKMTSAFIALGNFYRYANPDLDSILFYYMAALKTDSMNKMIFYNLAWYYNSKKNYDSAIYFGVKALDIDNGFRKAYGELGFSYNASKKYRAAVEQFEKNLAVSIIDLPLYYSGLAYIELKDKESALKQYEVLIKINEKAALKLKKRIDEMK